MAVIDGDKNQFPQENRPLLSVRNEGNRSDLSNLVIDSKTDRSEVTFIHSNIPQSQLLGWKEVEELGDL